MLQSILEALALPALAIDQSERIICANTEAETLLSQNMRGRNYVTMLRQPALLDAIELSLKDGAERRARYLSGDGAQDTTFDVTIRSIPAMPPDDSTALLVSFHDVSHIEQGGQMRRDFVANASHELRTPLTSLIGFIDTLRGPARNDPEATERFLEIMRSEAERMNRLVGDLMSLNRVEGDERVRPTARTELTAILGSVCRTMGPLAEEAGVVIEQRFEARDVDLIGDTDQLVQVFTNLVENALKYGGSGGRITLHVQATERHAALRAPGVQVQITDYGPGIDPVHLPRLTERFYRADDHRSRAMGGTGLGLAIVKHIINRHRGRLRVQSTLGAGATFTVILPIETFSPA